MCLAINRCLLAGLAGISIWSTGCARKAGTDSKAPVVYIAAPVQQDVSIYSEWIGTMIAFVDAEIHSQVSGYLLSQNYKEGSLVKKGDLFILDGQKIVVADRSKLGITATHLFCRIEEVNLLITDEGASDADVEPFLKKGIEVRRV